MSLKLIDIIAGARPNFMKIAPIISELEKEIKIGAPVNYRLIHTGQHYDKKMSADFFNQLGIPLPHFNLDSGSGTQAEQTAKIMTRYEELINIKPSNLCLVVGDVTSTMACSIVAKKMNIKVAHVEAGIRSYDQSMPEEINRIVTDSISDFYFTTSKTANKNLVHSGVKKSQIFFVGNTMIDTLFAQRKNLIKPHFWDYERLSNSNYFVLTLHRPSNVDSEIQLSIILSEILKHTRDLKVIFPVHPRTSKFLGDTAARLSNLILTEPLSYLEFIFLVKNAKAVITDSGGISEETTILNIPCLTLRNNTERPETCDIGTNELIGNDFNLLGNAISRVFEKKWKEARKPKYWDGKAAKRIVYYLLNDVLIDNKIE